MNKLFILLIVISTSVVAKDKWYVSDPNGFNFYLTTEIKNNVIEGYTRKNALKNIVGWTKFTLVKLTSSMKYPEIIHLNGVVDGNSLTGEIQNLFSKGHFKGTIENDSLILTVEQKNGKTFDLKGHKVKKFTAKRDYNSIYQHVFELTEDNLYKQDFLKTKKWMKFKKRILKLTRNIKDDLEMQIAFFAIVREFPFSHYQLNPIGDKKETTTQNTFAKLTEINKNTVVLAIDSFTGTKQQMQDLLEQIQTKNYSNLIIDLRNNYGGNFLSAYPLGQFLISKPLIAGIFPNQKWYKQHNRAPTHEEYAQFNEFSDGTMQEWITKASEKYGSYLKIYPSENHFTGKVYVLTNRNTASTCEPLIYALKQEKIATIIGENTRGAMLSMNTFPVDDGISLGIPLNDYITYSGDRIDRIGISPHVKVKSDKALSKALEIIAQD